MPGEPAPARGGRAVVDRLTLLEMMLLIAGAAAGLALVSHDVRQASNELGSRAIFAVGGLLGGLAVVGPPVLLLERRRRRRPWRAGRVAWFSHGMAAWLLWPPVVYNRANGRGITDSAAGVCFLYGTPLMAVYVTAALLAGGWIRRRRRRRPRSWRDRFGLLLLLAWACTGLYILTIIYREDLGR